MKIEVCDSRRVFVPANQKVTQFFPASEATMLALSADQDTRTKVNGVWTFLGGGRTAMYDAGARGKIDLSTIVLEAGERTAEVGILLSYTHELSAVDQLAELAR